MTEKDEAKIYRIEINKKSLKFLDKLNESKYDLLIEKIFKLENEPRPPGCVKLNTANAYRIRRGNYRVLYYINDPLNKITIYKISHRKDAYK